MWHFKKTGIGIFIVFTISSCGTSDISTDGSTELKRDSIPQTLFEQTYPADLILVNYFDLVPRKIRENLPRGLRDYGFNLDSVKTHKIKSITEEYYDGTDTLIGYLEFDKSGNIMYNKPAHNTGVGWYSRYQFDDKGRLARRLEFWGNKQLYMIEHFNYDDKNRINLVIYSNVDTISFVYDSAGNMIKAGNKTLKYDGKGNCIEWILDIKEPHCGNIVTHWKGEYDDDGNLINSWTNTDHLYFSIPNFKDEKYYNEKGHLKKCMTYKEDGELLCTDYYEYY